MSTQVRRVVSDGHHIPEPLKAYDVWVVWSPELGKTARAPWQEGHMYPAEWAADKPLDPRTSFEEASTVADLPIETIADRYPFPPDTDPKTVEPTILIPPGETDNDLVFVDFDDVVADGEIDDEVWNILKRLHGYTEISRSGNGLHVWVRGSLPDGYGKVIEPLDSRGQIEIYDRGRMTGCTWRHVRGTPTDDVPERTDAIETLIAEYETKRCPECESWTRAHDLDADEPACGACGNEFESPTGDGRSVKKKPLTRPSVGRERNPYYQLDIRTVADTGAFSNYRKRWQGPHPKHGGTQNKDSDSMNFNVEPHDGVWHCFAHGSGGGALSLVGVLDGIVTCQNAAQIHGDEDLLLRTCLAARKRYPELEGETPPYAALVAVARLADLPMKNERSGTLGRVGHEYAEKVYHQLDSYEDLLFD